MWRRKKHILLFSRISGHHLKVPDLGRKGWEVWAAWDRGTEQGQGGEGRRAVGQK